MKNKVECHFSMFPGESFHYEESAEGSVVCIHLLTELTDLHEPERYVSRMLETAVKRYHPEKILIDTDDMKYRNILQNEGCYERGDGYMKVVEPWRLKLPDTCFDEEGYLINQGLMKDIPFGWFDTEQKGCGWIAAYNLLKMCHRYTTMQKCAEGLSRTLILGGLAGQEEYLLAYWLRKQGLKVHVSLPSNSIAVKQMKAYDYGILLYQHNRGAHYTAYRNRNDGTFQFYNAVYGRRVHIQKAEDFLKQYALLPFASVITVNNYD